MLITNETPDITWTLSGIGGSNWQTGAPFSMLTNGRPRLGCKLFRDSTPGGFILEGTWSEASRPQVLELSGLGEEWQGLSFGASLSNSVSGSSPVDIGPAEVVRLPDGSLAAFVVIPTLAFSVDTLTLTADVPGSEYLIGEVVIATAQEWRIRRDWQETVIKLTKENLTISAQPFNVKRIQYRKASVTIAPVVFSRAYSIREQSETLQKLQARLSQNQPVLVIPALRAPGLGVGAPIDMDVIASSALFGWCSNLGQIGLVADSDLAELKLEFTEAPAGRVN